MKRGLLSSAKLFADEATAKVLAPGTGKTQTEYLSAIARDDRAHGGGDPPDVFCSSHAGSRPNLIGKPLADFFRIV